MTLAPPATIPELIRAGASDVALASTAIGEDIASRWQKLTAGE